MSRRRWMNLLVMTLMLGFLASCAKPSRELRLMVEECRKSDQVPLAKEENPGLAAGLGLIFGGGSFYTRQMELGVLSAVTWPFSVLWDPFIGYLGAKQINDQATLEACRQVRRQQRQAASFPTPSASEVPAQ